MASGINSNSASRAARPDLGCIQQLHAQAQQRLSSGQRISSRRDDASGSALAGRFGVRARGLGIGAGKLAVAAGRSMDAGFAVETAQIVRNHALRQAGSAMMAQAKLHPREVLSLLRAGSPRGLPIGARIGVLYPERPRHASVDDVETEIEHQRFIDQEYEVESPAANVHPQ